MMTKFVVFCLFASLCIHMSTQQETVHDCSEPKVVGPCRALIPRFFFNIVTNICERFFYGGCSGNTNNFETLDACIAACISARK